MGYECLAVDLRSGGNLYGPNRTVDALGKSTEYLDAYKDMEAALKWATDLKYKRIFVMGSSYSASLAFKLASEHKDVMGLVIFSPGEYLSEKGIVAKWSSSLKIPILAVCTYDELDSVEAIVLPEGAPNNRQIDSSTDYIHGASTLRPDKKIPHTDSIWRMIKDLLVSNPSRTQ
jgi:dienelactone hydrolase